ncbi:hypothetical protein L1887_61425 [Cichorium endivia]|nr:hypothetical protein L1887_61425 [Cichorium endivia]
MSTYHSTALSRPSLGHRSISEQAPLYEPSSAAHVGSRLRGSKATSGSVTQNGSHLPFSPLLPLPPVVDIKLHEAEREFADDEQAENCAPHMFPGHHRPPVGPSALATRRQARRGVSEGFAALHPHQVAGNRAGLGAQPAVLTPGGKGALRLDIAAAADSKSQQACRSAGMIRSYSMPVATQDEHDEQQRIMALGLSPIGRYAANPAWWQYGWPSPGGVNHRHLHRAPVPEMLGQRRGSAQSKLAAVVAPAMGPLAAVVIAGVATTQQPLEQDSLELLAQKQVQASPGHSPADVLACCSRRRCRSVVVGIVIAQGWSFAAVDDLDQPACTGAACARARRGGVRH